MTVWRIVPGLVDLARGTVPGFTFEEIAPGVYIRTSVDFPIDLVFEPDGSYCGVVEMEAVHP
jgi:hypothetical protein